MGYMLARRGVIGGKKGDRSKCVVSTRPLLGYEIGGDRAKKGVRVGKTKQLSERVQGKLVDTLERLRKWGGGGNEISQFVEEAKRFGARGPDCFVGHRGLLGNVPVGPYLQKEPQKSKQYRHITCKRGWCSKGSRTMLPGL